MADVDKEQVRNLRGKGMRERDAILVSMKNKKSKKESEQAAMPVGPSYDYPYGLSIELNEDSLDKLGIKKLPDVGDKVTVRAEAKVESVSNSQHSEDDKAHRNVRLQITKMSVNG